MQAHTLRPLPIPLGGATRSTFWQRYWHALVRGLTGGGAEIFSTRLAAGNALKLHGVAGWTIVCRSGTVWITQEGDTRDIFLEEGEGFALDRGGLALVCACREATLSIRAPARGRFAGRSRWARDAGPVFVTADDQAQLTWLRSLYPECGPWNDPVSYRRAGLL